MAQRDYLLRMFQEMGRFLAQVMYQRQIKNYTGALNLIDEQFQQTLGMGAGFIHSVPEETLLKMLTSLGELNVEKCWLLATLLKMEGDVYEDQENLSDSFYSYLKACNLFLEVLFDKGNTKGVGTIPEIEELLPKLEDYELPLRTKQLLFLYFAQTERYAAAEDKLWEALETDGGSDNLDLEEQGRGFYTRLLKRSEQELRAGNFSREAAREGLERLQGFVE